MIVTDTVARAPGLHKLKSYFRTLPTGRIALKRVSAEQEACFPRWIREGIRDKYNAECATAEGCKGGLAMCAFRTLRGEGNIGAADCHHDVPVGVLLKALKAMLYCCESDESIRAKTQHERYLGWANHTDAALAYDMTAEELCCLHLLGAWLAYEEWLIELALLADLDTVEYDEALCMP